jgi:UDP-glucose 4-epimerase
MVYGDFKDDVNESAVCSPQGQYGILKLAGEWLVKDYTRKHGIEHTILRPSAVYGPLDVEDRVISKFLLTAMRGETLKVNGPNETLDFTYVDDAADGFVAATLSDRAANGTYNITKSHSKTLLSAAELAVKLAGNGRIEVRDKDADFPSRGALNIDAARRDFGFDPPTPARPSGRVAASGGAGGDNVLWLLDRRAIRAVQGRLDKKSRQRPCPNAACQPNAP